MFTNGVQEPDWGMMGFGGMSCPLDFRVVQYVTSRVPCHSVTRKQHPCPSNTRRWFRQLPVTYRCSDGGGGRGGVQIYMCVTRCGGWLSCSLPVLPAMTLVLCLSAACPSIACMTLMMLPPFSHAKQGTFPLRLADLFCERHLGPFFGS